MEEIRQRVREEHGPLARIVSAERVIPRGLGRSRKPPYFEAIVELPDETAGSTVRMELSGRAGLAALLADADDEQDAINGQSAAPAAQAVRDSTADDFDEIMAGLSALMPPAVAAPGIPMPSQQQFPWAPTRLAPALPRVAGDLVAVVSLGGDALAVAQAMAKASGAGEVRGAGTIKTRGRAPLTDRRSALLARADGVEHGKVVFCAFGLEAGSDQHAAVAAIDADQVWVVVDARRKDYDTRRWLAALTEVVDVAAIAVIGAAETNTPETVDALGFPVGWRDTAPA